MTPSSPTRPPKCASESPTTPSSPSSPATPGSTDDTLREPSDTDRKLDKVLDLLNTVLRENFDLKKKVSELEAKVAATEAVKGVEGQVVDEIIDEAIDGAVEAMLATVTEFPPPPGNTMTY